MRDDIKGVTVVPTSTVEFLERYGGKTPFGEPMWRIVLAQNVYWKLAGNFKIWDESLSLNERGGIDMWHGGKQFENRPLRVECGMVERKKYPHLEGWILQKWYPASKYSKTMWFAPENCMADGTPKLGPFPEYGDYELVSGPYPQIPTLSQLQLFISDHLRRLDEMNQNVEQRILDNVYAAQQEEQEYEKRLEAKVDDYLTDKCSYIDSCSLEAGRIRTKLAEKIGIRTHVGA